tara:strand:- start:445 stop:843 length:399 start_codon:yes stop_codon:yes gene_type:complete
MIEFMDNNKDGDAWIKTDKYSIWIEESSTDGSIRIEVVLGDHLGQAVANLMVSAPREEDVPTPKPEPAIPWQKRAVKALVDAGYKKQVIALMMSCHVRSIENWSRGKPITGPNRERLLHVMESMKVEVADED